MASKVEGPQPRRWKKSQFRVHSRPTHWSAEDTPIPARRDQLQARRWRRAIQPPNDVAPPSAKFAKYNIEPVVPTYDADVYEQHLTHADWTRGDTDHLVATYRECNGKWPVIVDHYESERRRSMEELKARFYSLSKTLLALGTPISSMGGPEWGLHETLRDFEPTREASRKRLAEGHMQRRQEEVDEETVLLSELQRIMLHQATLDNEREDLRRRLDHPQANSNSYPYSTSQSLTQLWQQLLAADRVKKSQRLRPTGNPSYDGPGFAVDNSTSARPANAVAPDANNRRTIRESLPSATTPQSALPVDLSKAELSRYGVVIGQDKLPSGVTFASDRLSKPRIAKSTLQTDKIAAILTHAGVPDLIPLPTPAVVESFDALMGTVHTLLDLRKLAEKEEQELRVRQAETS
ncbi:swr complex subunit [Friedmanniomyces endolithicus]|nr:swr complex subunit [Friedmanniomyces endolithicus]KAK0781788.1 swr complex subunit [Friedmanniomyces endolithicus]KAK0792678.1 swr complex subunit [Friedmanniomyces endolithicus]KAK0801820.1 swr complex subunit [Friedmanniomyces endolithicus]KAK0858669.1 swr complex subunit [Friedmanniomyces endolithicus]